MTVARQLSSIEAGLFIIGSGHLAGLGIDQVDTFADDAGQRLIDVAVLLGRIIGDEPLNSVAGYGAAIEESGRHSSDLGT
jgi:hypothetical protein